MYWTEHESEQLHYSYENTHAHMQILQRLSEQTLRSGRASKLLLPLGTSKMSRSRRCPSSTLAVDPSYAAAWPIPGRAAEAALSTERRNYGTEGSAREHHLTLLKQQNENGD